MNRLKFITSVAALAAIFSFGVSAQTYHAPDIPGGVKPVTIPVTALCSPGSPEQIFAFLISSGEVPRYKLPLSEIGVLYITESKRPSASVIIYNQRANGGKGATCWFWWTEGNVEFNGMELPEIPLPEGEKEEA